MLEQLQQIIQTALTNLEQVSNEEHLDSWRVTYLGRSSPLMQVFDKLGQLHKEERPVIGRRANEVKRALEAALAEQSARYYSVSLWKGLSNPSVWMSLCLGGRWPAAACTRRCRPCARSTASLEIWASRSTARGRWRQTSSISSYSTSHPTIRHARCRDSYYIDTGTERGDNPVLLRTHTSPGQIRAMRELAALNPANPPAVRLILPGMCYRYEQISARYEIQFTQVEGLAIGEHITFGDLKGTISDFGRRLFNQNLRSRFRASHFPFTEPSAEVDFECFLCNGAGCPVCKYTGWLEIMGCGMVHPVVLQNGGYDPARYTGFAFGMGPERLTMLRHRIDDIRYFWANDLRFLEQF